MTAHGEHQADLPSPIRKVSASRLGISALDNGEHLVRESLSGLGCPNDGRQPAGNPSTTMTLSRPSSSGAGRKSLSDLWKTAGSFYMLVPLRRLIFRHKRQAFPPVLWMGITHPRRHTGSMVTSREEAD